MGSLPRHPRHLLFNCRSSCAPAAASADSGVVLYPSDLWLAGQVCITACCRHHILALFLMFRVQTLKRLAPCISALWHVCRPLPPAPTLGGHFDSHLCFCSRHCPSICRSPCLRPQRPDRTLNTQLYPLLAFAALSLRGSPARKRSRRGLGLPLLLWKSRGALR